jgi:c-di-GMP-binding flagellar brake protein YcgR
MTLQEIKIGTRLELDILSKYGEKVGNTLVSQLLEYQDDGTMVISAPIYESRVFYIPSDVTIRLIYFHQQYGMLGFTAQVISREYRGKIAVMIIQPDNNIDKIQRRMHYRLDIIADVIIMPILPKQLHPVNKDLSGNTAANGSDTTVDDTQKTSGMAQHGTAAESPDGIKAYTKNISGSGVCVICETNFPKNTEVMAIIDLMDSLQIKAKCSVVRSEAVEVRKGRSYELGMRFTDIKSKDQEALIRFIFEQQRMLLRKDK